MANERIDVGDRVRTTSGGLGVVIRIDAGGTIAYVLLEADPAGGTPFDRELELELAPR